eukprot:CAMPEP_0168481762 /NCGR_PEP_ID=MMETSP0228-20121227/64681_1 /TAXON_ID=133427 /ORGANISM="Protoceratium reticulatum, Strain CCCM 535 (=CCMP 1889)" /LENGTH=71 /DNA_ID=CAMNT_0008498145 /DNA_START=11 /DNA_END=223 /DNA_ORIENTATION=+
MVSAQRDTYQAAAFNTMRMRRSSHLTWKLNIFKTRMDAPWYYDSVAFGVVSTASASSVADLRASQADLMLN